MGTYLSTPVTDKESSEGEDEQFKFGVSAMQGWRVSMEDAHSTVMNVPDIKGQPSSIGFFGVFDGHGGKEVALFAAKHLAPELVKTEGWHKGNLEEAIRQAYMKLDANLSREDTWDELSKFAAQKRAGEEENKDGEAEGHDFVPESIRNALGARLASIDPDDPNWDGDDFDDPPFDPMIALDEGRSEDISDMDVMTRGDSEESDEDDGSGDLTGKDAEGDSGSSSSDSDDAVGLNPNPLGYHGPSAGCTAVVALIAKDSLVVANAGDSRCIASRNGVAHAMSHDHKPTDEVEATRISKTPELDPSQQMITANPDIQTLKLEAGDEFLILACDGIWDVLSNQQAVDFVRERLRKGMTPRAVCEAMCDSCLAPDADGFGEGCDNMSAMVVVLKNYASQETLNGVTIPQPMPPPGA